MARTKKEPANAPEGAAYFRNNGGPQIVALHGPVQAREVIQVTNTRVAEGLRKHSRYQELTEAEYKEHREKNDAGPQFRTGAGDNKEKEE